MVKNVQTWLNNKYPEKNQVTEIDFSDLSSSSDFLSEESELIISDFPNLKKTEIKKTLITLLAK